MSQADTAARFGLTRVGARPTLGAYVRQVWERRDFTYTLARYRIQSENERNRLGMLWVLLRPIMSALVYGTIFGVILGSAGRPEDFVPFLVIGVFTMEFFNGALSSGAKSIIGNANLVQSLSFPRAVLPIATVAQQFMNFVPTVVLMVLLTIPFGGRPSLEWLLLIPLYALMFLFCLGVAFIAARLTVHFRDLSQFIPFISRMIFYTSGVFFSLETMAKNYGPVVEALVAWHPLHEVLTIARGLLLPTYDVPIHFWLYFAIWSVVIFVVGAVYFWQAEERYGRDD